MKGPFPYVLAFMECALLAPLFIRIFPAIRLVDEPGGRKSHMKPTPLAGGLVFLLATWVTIVLADPTVPFPWVLGALAAFATGLADDWLKDGLPWRIKLFLQFVSAAIPAIFLFPGGYTLKCIFMIWALVVINSINFQDNMNGLAIGTSIVVFSIILLSGRGNGNTALISGTSIACLVPLLFFNFPDARLFLGDQGSILIGYTVSVATFFGAKGNSFPDPWLLAAPALPVLDMAATIAFRFKRGLALTRPDQNHLSHRLSRAGLGNVLAVAFLWAGTATVWLFIDMFLNLTVKTK